MLNTSKWSDSFSSSKWIFSWKSDRGSRMKRCAMCCASSLSMPATMQNSALENRQWPASVISHPIYTERRQKQTEHIIIKDAVYTDVTDATVDNSTKKWGKSLGKVWPCCCRQGVMCVFTCIEELFVDLFIDGQLNVIVFLTTAGEVAVNRIIPRFVDPEFVVFQRLQRNRYTILKRPYYALLGAVHIMSFVRSSSLF